MARKVPDWEISVLTWGLKDACLIRCSSCDAELEFRTITPEVVKWDCRDCQQSYCYYPVRRREAIMATKAKHAEEKENDTEG